MREETRKKFERQIWLSRLKWVGAGLGVLALMGLGFWYTGLDATVVTTKVPGTITYVGPLSGTNSQAIEEGLAVDVKLDDGRLAHVMALKTRNPKVGDHIEIAEHSHGSGRVTFTWK